MTPTIQKLLFGLGTLCLIGLLMCLGVLGIRYRDILYYPDVVALDAIVLNTTERTTVFFGEINGTYCKVNNTLYSVQAVLTYQEYMVQVSVCSPAEEYICGTDGTSGTSGTYACGTIRLSSIDFTTCYPIPFEITKKQRLNVYWNATNHNRFAFLEKPPQQSESSLNIPYTIFSMFGFVLCAIALMHLGSKVGEFVREMTPRHDQRLDLDSEVEEEGNEEEISDKKDLIEEEEVIEDAKVPNKEGANNETCIVCQTRKRKVACSPCGHLYSCKECATKWSGKCAICQKKINKFLPIYS
jgi:hypothetical protein